jgi:hypothetical protein
MTDTQFIRGLPQREHPRGFTRALTAEELSRLEKIAAQHLRDGDSVHRPDLYGNVHEARMLLATL